MNSHHEIKEFLDRKIETIENSIDHYYGNIMPADVFAALIDKFCAHYTTHNKAIAKCLSKQEITDYMDRLQTCYNRIYSISNKEHSAALLNSDKHLRGVLKEMQDNIKHDFYREDMVSLHTERTLLEKKLKTLHEPKSNMVYILLFAVSLILLVMGCNNSSGFEIIVGANLFLVWMLAMAQYSKKANEKTDIEERIRRINIEINETIQVG